MFHSLVGDGVAVAVGVAVVVDGAVAVASSPQATISAMTAGKTSSGMSLLIFKPRVVAT